MESNQQSLSGAVSTEQAEAWKKEHGQVHTVQFVDPEGKPLVGYFRDVRMAEYSYLMSLQGRPFEQYEELARQTWLGGDARVMSDWKLTYMAGQALDKAIQMPVAELGKL